MSSSSESESEPREQQEEGQQVEEGQEEEPRVTEPEEHDETTAKDEGGSPGGGSRDGGIRPRCRIMEPAPPTYEEALTFFVRDGNSNGNGGGSRSGQLAIAEVAANGSGGGGRRQSLSEDYEMAERLQQEEIERCRSLPGRERSASLAGLPYGAGGRTPTRGERWSVSSAPGDARSSAYRNFSLGQSLQSPRGRLRTIQEDEESVITDANSARRRPNSDPCTRSCCYYSCFGFPLFTDRLSPTLQQAWREGARQVVETALPTFSTPWRYLFFCVQLAVIAACIILSFASTPLEGENIVRNASLVGCILVNLIERFVSWCGCCRSKMGGSNKFSDVTRNLLTDLSLYPAVLASIMNTLNTRSYNVAISLWDNSVYHNVSDVNVARRDDAINFSMNLLVVLLFVVMVHLLRLWQVGRIAKTLAGEFKKNVSGARSTSRAFITIFFFHVLLWSIVQTLYLCLVGYRMHIEMSEPSQPQILGVSVYLFVMMVSGGLAPLVGVFMYLIATQKWAEEFPIAFFLDRMPSQQSRSVDISHDRVEHQFKRLHEANMRCSGCLYGLIHPLVSPLQMMLTTSFFALWVLFAFTYPVSSLSHSNIDLVLSDASHGLIGVVATAVVCGLVVILSFIGNLVPLLYGFLGLAMLPFWLLFYTIVSCSALCRKKS